LIILNLQISQDKAKHEVMR